jgi:hypothetical protein
MSILINKHWKAITHVVTILLLCVGTRAYAQSPITATASEFGDAAAACIDAASPDKLDANKLLSRGWKKVGNHKAPLGEVLIFAHANNGARIFSSSSPSGFCIVDGYGQNSVQFDAFRLAVGNRLKADFGMDGQTDVKIGNPGSATRRQGFVIGNAVGALSSEMRQTGFNVRFVTVNVKFAGSPAMFQTSRPPLSEAEIAENRAKDRQDFDYADGMASSQDIVPLVNACATSLRNNAALPSDGGWRKSIHGSGTPRSLDAIKSGDIKAMMAGIAHTRQMLYRVGQRGFVTKYFVRGTHMVCEALIKIDPSQRNAARNQVVSALGLGQPQNPSAQTKEFAAEYALDDLTETYAIGASTVALHSGEGTGFERPDPATATFSVFVF